MGGEIGVKERGGYRVEVCPVRCVSRCVDGRGTAAAADRQTRCQ